MGSGVLIKAAIKKHGLQNFNKIVLFLARTEKEMLEKEIELISSLKPKYNLHEGGLGGWQTVNTNRRGKERPHNSRFSRLTTEERKKFSSMGGKIGIKKLHAINKANGGTFKGRKHSEETKAKMRKSAKHRRIGVRAA